MAMLNNQMVYKSTWGSLTQISQIKNGYGYDSFTWRTWHQALMSSPLTLFWLITHLTCTQLEIP